MKYFTLLFIFVLLNFLYASDLGKEKRWADVIVDSILGKDTFWL